MLVFTVSKAMRSAEGRSAAHVQAMEGKKKVFCCDRFSEVYEYVLR